MLKHLAMAVTLCAFTGGVSGQPNNAPRPKQPIGSQTNASPALADAPHEQTDGTANQPKPSGDPPAGNTTLEGSKVWWRDSNWWLVVVAGLTGAVIGWQSYESKRATDSFRMKERARLTLEVGPYQPLGAIQSAQVTLTVTNHGDTKAFIGKARCAVFIRRTDWETKDLGLEYGLQMRIPNVLSPAPYTLQESIVYTDEADEADDSIVIVHNLLQEENTSIFVVGYIEFSDVFRNDWRLNFSRSWGGMYSGKMWAFTDEWMTWPAYPDGEEKIKKQSKLAKLWKRFILWWFWNFQVPANGPKKPN